MFSDLTTYEESIVCKVLSAYLMLPQLLTSAEGPASQQVLVELELPHIYHTVARNSPKRKEMEDKWGVFQVILLGTRLRANSHEHRALHRRLLHGKHEVRAQT